MSHKNSQNIDCCFEYCRLLSEHVPGIINHQRNITWNFLIWIVSVSDINPSRAHFFIGNIKKMYLQFISYLHTDVIQVVEILPRGRQELAYSTESILWVLMSWRRKEPGHQQPLYQLCWDEIIQPRTTLYHVHKFAVPAEIGEFRVHGGTIRVKIVLLLHVDSA